MEAWSGFMEGKGGLECHHGREKAWSGIMEKVLGVMEEREGLKWSKKIMGE